MSVELDKPSRYSKQAMKERAVGLQPRAYSIPEFCAVYGLGRSKAYEQIGAGRLKTRKVGRATLIATEDAEAWFLSLAEAA